MKPLKVLGRDLRFSNAFDDQPLPDMRKHYRPRRRPTDSNPAEWSAAQRFIPQSMIHSRNRATPVRYLLNATLFRLTNAIPLRALPRDFPPWGSVHAFEEHLKVLGAWPPMLHAMGRDHLIPRLDKLMRDQPESLPLSLSEDNWGPTPVKTEIIGKIHEDGSARDPEPLEKHHADVHVHAFGIRHAVESSDASNPESQKIRAMVAIHPIGLRAAGLYATSDKDGNFVFHSSKDLDREYHGTTDFINFNKLLRDRHKKALDAGAVYAKIHVHPEIRPHLGAIHAETEEHPYYDMGKHRDEMPYLAFHDALIENGFDDHAAELMKLMTTPDPDTGAAGFPPHSSYLSVNFLGKEDPSKSDRSRFSLSETRILGRTVRFSIDSFGPSPIKTEENGHVIVHTGPGIQTHANTNDPESIGDPEDRRHAMNARDLQMVHRQRFMAQALSGDPEDNLYAVDYPHIGGVDLRRPGIYLYSDGKGNITAHTSRNEYGDLDRDFYRDDASFEQALRRAHDYAVGKGKTFQRISVHPEIEPHIKAVLDAHSNRDDEGKADEAPLLIMSDLLDEQGYGDHADMARDVSRKYGKLPRHWVVGQLAIPDPLRPSQNKDQDIEDDVNRFALDPDRPIMSFEPEGKVNRIMLNSSDRAREIASRDILNRNTEINARNLALKAMRNGKHMASSFLPFNESSGHYNAVYLIADPEGNVTAHHLAADSLLPFDPATLNENLDKAHNLHRFANFSSDPHFNPTSSDVVKNVVDLHNKALQDNQVFGRYHVQEDFKPHLGAILNAHRDYLKDADAARWRPMELTEDEPQEDEAPRLLAKDYLLDEGHPAYDKIETLFGSQEAGEVPHTARYLDNLHGDYELDERNQQFSLTQKVLGRTVRMSVAKGDMADMLARAYYDQEGNKTHVAHMEYPGILHDSGAPNGPHPTEAHLRDPYEAESLRKEAHNLASQAVTYGDHLHGFMYISNSGKPLFLSSPYGGLDRDDSLTLVADPDGTVTVHNDIGWNDRHRQQSIHRGEIRYANIDDQRKQLKEELIARHNQSKKKGAVYAKHVPIDQDFINAARTEAQHYADDPRSHAFYDMIMERGSHPQWPEWLIIDDLTHPGDDPVPNHDPKAPYFTPQAEEKQSLSLSGYKILGRVVRFAVSEDDDAEPSYKQEAHPMDATKELDALRNRTWDSYTDEERYPHGRGHHEKALDGDSRNINDFEAALKHLKESDPDYPGYEEAFLSALDAIPGATERVMQRRSSIAAGPNSNDLPDTRGYLDEFRYLEKHPHVGKGMVLGGAYEYKYLPFLVRDWNEPKSIPSFPLPDAEKFRRHIMGNATTRPAQLIKIGLSHGKTDAVPIEGSMVHFTDEKGKLAFPAIVQHVETSKDKNHLFVRPIHDWDSVSDLGNSRIKPLVDAYEHAYLYDNHYPLQPASDNAGAQAMMPAIIQAHRAGQRDMRDFKYGIARYNPNDYGASFPAAVPHTPDNWDLDRNEASGINGALRAALRSHGSILMARHGFAQSISPEDEKLRAKLFLSPLAEKVIASLKANPDKMPEQAALDVVRAEFPHRPNLDEKTELLAYLDRHDMPGAADPKHIQQFDNNSLKKASPFEMEMRTDQSPMKAAKLAVLLENGDQDAISDYIKTVGPFDELKRFAQELIRRDNLAKKMPPDLEAIYKKGADGDYLDIDIDTDSPAFKKEEDKYKAMYEWLDKNDIIGEGLPVPGDIPEGTEGKELEMSRRLNHRFREEAIGDTLNRIKNAVVKLNNERQLQRANRGEIPDRDLKLSLGEQRILGRTVRFSVDMIPGGLADDKTDADFDPQALDKGQKVEMEHTSDPAKAREIARDHLAESRDYYKKLRLVEGGTRILGRVMRFSLDDDWGPTPVKVEKIGDINSDQDDVQLSDIHQKKLNELDNKLSNSGLLTYSPGWSTPRLLSDEKHLMDYSTIHLPEYDPFGHKTESGLYATMDGQGRVAVHMSDDIDEMHRETPTRLYGDGERASYIRDTLDRLHEQAMNSGKIYAETKVYPGFEPLLKAIREAVGNRMKIKPQSRDHAPSLIASDWLKENGFDAHGEALVRMMDDADPINARHGGFAPSLDYLARDILFHKDPHAQLDRELEVGRPLRYSLSGTKVLGRTIRFAMSDFNDIPNAYTIPQDSPPYPIEGEPTFISPPRPPEPSKPGPYVPEAENPPMNLGQEPPTEEDIDQAERRQAGSHQTANHVRRIQTPDGRVYYLKKFLSNNLVEPHAEVAASAILRHLGFDNVPQSHLITTRQGQFTVSPAVRGTPLSHVLGIDIPPFGEEDPQTVPPDEEKARKLREANPPEKVADLLTAQWLINRADAHEANVLVGDNGELHPIDFGQSLHPEVEYHPGWSYNHDAIIGYGLAHPNTPVNKDFIRRILDQEDEITQLAEDKLKDAPPHWREQALETLANKFDQLDRIANYDNPTLADLPEDHTPRLGYNRRGSRIWQPWVHD